MRLLVVGAGEMGTWFARTLTRELDESIDLAVADADDAVARAGERPGEPGAHLAGADDEQFHRPGVLEALAKGVRSERPHQAGRSGSIVQPRTPRNSAPV